MKDISLVFYESEDVKYEAVKFIGTDFWRCLVRLRTPASNGRGNKAF
jgi:hypothetical protein